ncbi:hypothetical protein PG984_014538 [Apiospora sp. TS-2023a]
MPYFGQLQKHYLSVAEERTHPLSLHAERRLHHFAEDCHLSRLEDVTGRFYNPTPKYDDVTTKQAAAGAAEIEVKYLYRYAKVFKGVREGSGK